MSVELALAVDQSVVESHMLLDMVKRENWLTLDKISNMLALREIELWCVDGRRKDPGLCIVGGSTGKLMRLNAAFVACVLEHERAKVTAAILARFAGEYAVFQEFIIPCLHTDEHASSQHNEIGCGYLKLLRDVPEEFGLPSKQFVLKLNEIHCSKEDGFEELVGDHNELGAIVVLSECGSIPKLAGEKEGKQFFLYYPQVEEIAVDFVAPKIHEVLQNITNVKVDYNLFREKVSEVTQRHLETTLRKLAPGKPIFEALIQSNEAVKIRQIA